MYVFNERLKIKIMLEKHQKLTCVKPSFRTVSYNLNKLRVNSSTSIVLKINNVFGFTNNYIIIIKQYNTFLSKRIKIHDH